MQKLFGALKRQNYHGKISEKSEKHYILIVQIVRLLRKAAQVHSRIPEAQFHQR